MEDYYRHPKRYLSKYAENIQILIYLEFRKMKDTGKSFHRDNAIKLLEMYHKNEPDILVKMDKDGNTLLSLCVYDDNMEAVKILVEDFGVDPDIKSLDETGKYLPLLDILKPIVYNDDDDENFDLVEIYQYLGGS